MAKTNMTMAGRRQPNQGLPHHSKESSKPPSFDLITGISICCVGMVMIIGRVTSNEVILDIVAYVLFALTCMKGNNFHKLISVTRVKTRLLVVICLLGVVMNISGVQSLIDQNEDLQSCPLADSNTWKIMLYRSEKSPLVMALPVGLLILGLGAVVALMRAILFEYRSSVQDHVSASVAPAVAPAPVLAAAAVAAPAAIAPAIAPQLVAAAVPAVVAAAPVVPPVVIPAAPAAGAGPFDNIDVILRDDPEHPNRREGTYTLWPNL